MKKKLTTITVIAVVLLIGATSVFAYADYLSPAQIYAKLKGISDEEAYELRGTGVTYGQLAEEEGIGEEFREEMLQNKKELIQQRVEEGILTQEQADALIERMELNITNCNGAGYGLRANTGMGFGRSSGFRGGCGGYGQGRGYGRGNGFNQ